MNLKQLEDELRGSRQHAKLLEREIQDLRDSVIRVHHHIPLPRRGIDYAFAPHPPVDRLKSAGISFVCRYVGLGNDSGKYLTEQEARELTNAGIDIVALYESTGKTFEGGYNVGVEDAHKAKAALDHLKPRGNPPVIFTCDADVAGEGRVGEALEYIRGAVHTIGWYRVGMYAGYEPVTAAHAANRCKFYFQTYAWSDGKWSPHAQVRQVQNDIHIFGANCDLDEAVAADFGQFRV